VAYQREPDVDPLAGGLFGAVSFTVGLFVAAIRAVIEDPPAAGNVPVETTSGFAVVDQHGVAGYLVVHLRSHDLGLVSGGSLELALLPVMLVVIVTLLATGYVVASMAGRSRSTGGFKHGASIAGGYLPLVVLTSVVVIVQVPDVGAVETLLSVLIAGGVYPVVFGGLGGAIAKAT
jgi:hypothetical protein